MKRSVVVGICVGLSLLASAVDARAQMTMGTFKGYLTGHVGVVTADDVTNERIAAGASIGVQESNGWGAEVDFGRSTDVDAAHQSLDLTTYFVNAAWVKPRGIIRPFGTVGAGILQIESSARTNDLGLSAGGGTFLVINDVAALRADARYFFSMAEHPELRRPDNFGFWRISIGATFMWAIIP